MHTDPETHPAVPGRTTRPLKRVAAPSSDAGRHWIVTPDADLDGFLRQVAAVCEATGPGGGPPDFVWLKEVARVYGLVPVEPRAD